MLQHHGAATPLLDVSLDPLVGLSWESSVRSQPTDARGWRAVCDQATSGDFPGLHERRLRGGLRQSAVRRSVMYSAPDVSERLRTQRGQFLLQRFAVRGSNFHTCRHRESTRQLGSLSNAWIYRLMAARGREASDGDDRCGRVSHNGQVQAGVTLGWRRAPDSPQPSCCRLRGTAHALRHVLPSARPFNRVAVAPAQRCGRAGSALPRDGRGMVAVEVSGSPEGERTRVL